MRRLNLHVIVVTGVLAALLGVTSAARPAGAAENPYADERIVAYGWVGEVDEHGWDCPVPVDRVTSISVGRGEQLLLCIGLVNFSDEWMTFGILRDGDIAIWDYRDVPLPPNYMSTFGFSYTADEARTFDYYWHPIDESGVMLSTFAQINVGVGPVREPPEPTEPPPGPIVPGLDFVAEEVLTVDLTAQADDGTDDCATEQAIAVDVGTTVAFCYRLTNVGTESLDLHDVVDSVHGQVVRPDRDDPLAPGDSLSYVARAPADASALHVLSWTATTASGRVLHGEDALSVITLEAGIELHVTVGPDEGEGVCGPTDDLIVEPGTAVRFCYTMTNVGDEAVDVHSLFDDRLGWIFEDDMVSVAPGESIVREAVTEASESALTIASWAAERESSGIETVAVDSARVVVAAPCPSSEAADAPPSPGSTPIVPAQPPSPAQGVDETTNSTSIAPTTTTTTSTEPPSTTSLVFVIPTTTSSPGFAAVTTVPPQPVGFARGLDFAPTPCPSSEGSEPPTSTDPDGGDPGGGEPGGGDPGGSGPGGGDPGGGDPGSGGQGGSDPAGPPAATLPATG